MRPVAQKPHVRGQPDCDETHTERFMPALHVPDDRVVDTNGAGDVFHGAFCYAVLQGLPIQETLDLSNALAALNCTALGARGKLATLAEAKSLMGRAERRINQDYARVSA